MRNDEDRLVWKDSKDGKFFGQNLPFSFEAGGRRYFSYKDSFKFGVPTKVRFFPWEAMWGKVLTLNHLKRRRWVVANQCYLCKGTEKLDHMLLPYHKTRILWDLLFSCFDVKWVLISSVKETLISWQGDFVGKNHC